MTGNEEKATQAARDWEAEYKAAAQERDDCIAQLTNMTTFRDQEKERADAYMAMAVKNQNRILALTDAIGRLVGVMT